MAMTSCTWVKDDNEDCPYGFWLQLHYTYNILDVEAAPRYVNDALVYVYNADGQFVRHIKATHDELAANNYRVRVEDLPEGDYQFVVWSGLNNSLYVITGDTQPMNDFRLSLSVTSSGYANELPDLYYGNLNTVHYDDSYAVHHIELMKNTNQLACLVVSISDKAAMDADDYTMKIVAANSTMDARNQLVTNAVTTYLPYSQGNVTFDDPDYGQLHGLQFNLMTLRLTNQRDCRVILEKRSTGQELFNVSIPEYIGMIGSLYTNMGQPLTVQEYLDRQDFYTVVFYLSDDLDQLIQMRVNSWRLRANNHLKL